MGVERMGLMRLMGPMSRIRPISPIRAVLHVVHLNPRPHKNLIAAGDGGNQQRD